MRLIAASVAGLSLFLIAGSTPTATLATRVGRYLAPARARSDRPDLFASPPLRHAGLMWTGDDVRLRRIAAAAGGAVAGLLAAQGDLFLAGPARSPLALGVLGMAGGVLAMRIWVTQRTERRSRRLRAELPVVADLIALRILAGESVEAALQHVVVRTSGVAATELGEALDIYRGGEALSVVLQALGRASVAPEAERLYGLLANAHQSGGRLADALLHLAADYRAGQERSLTEEGGKRALAVYAPILAVMIPVALLFLMYPTLAGLSQLSTVP